MKNYLGRLVLLVEDYDKAFEFYNTNFGFQKLHDTVTDEGQRYLHIGFEETPSIGLWLLEAANDSQKELVGHQSGGQPTLVIYTNQLNNLYHKLLENGVMIKVDPMTDKNYKFFHCFDLYGNEIVVTEFLN